MKKICFTLLVMSMSMPVSAEIYRWVDENGNVHFGDRAGSATATEMKLKDTGSGGQGSAPDEFEGEELTREEKRQRILDAMNEDREERNKLKKEESERKKAKKKRCARLRDKLRNLSGATGVYDLDEDGKRVFLSNKDRSRSEQSLRKMIASHCR